MKHAVFCARKSRTDSYVGGIITILNDYIRNNGMFCDCGYQVELFDYHPEKTLHNSKLNNIYYAIKQRKAVIHTFRSQKCDVFHIHTSQEFLFLKDIFVARAVSGKLHIPTVLTVHVGLASTVFNRIQPFQKFCISSMNRYINKTIFLTEKIRQEFIALGLQEDRTEVLENFHDLAVLKPEDRLTRTAQIHILFVGAIHRDKGIVELLTALNSLTGADFHLDICGKMTDQSIQDDFEKLTRSLGNKVTVHGYVSGSPKTALFERADIFVLPSYHEGMPLVILEALAGGCAIISTKVGGTPELLSDENVSWVDVRSSDQIADRIAAFIDHPEALNQMKKANLVKSEKFTIDANIQKLCRIYDACGNPG